jgi:hypothetical protein
LYSKDFKAPGSIARVDKNIVLFPEKEGLDGLEYEIFYTIEKFDPLIGSNSAYCANVAHTRNSQIAAVDGLTNT